MTVDIQPVETDGQFWINLKLDGDAMQPRGPFATPDEAEAAACRIAAMCRGMHFGVNYGTAVANKA